MSHEDIRIYGQLRGADVNTLEARLLRTDSAGNLLLNTHASDIMQPTDLQSIYRVQSILTTTLLLANATYTSDPIDGIQFKSIVGVLLADKDGSLQIQESYNLISWITTATIAISANAPSAYSNILHSRYVRLFYTNGSGGNQGSFELSGFLTVS